MAQTKGGYTADDIQVLEGLEPVRKRPGMYIGGTGKDGYHHLLWEVVDNSIDEVINKHATKVEVTLHKNGKSGDGRGQRPRHPRRHHEAKQKKPALEVIYLDAALRWKVRARQVATPSRVVCTASARPSSTRCPPS